MAKIELSQLVSEMTPEQKILSQHFYQTFDNKSAANRTIVNVEPLYYIGSSAASEFLTYAATKMYLCLSFAYRLISASAQGTATIMGFYDAANVSCYTITNDAITYNTTTPALNYNPNNMREINFFFSRILPTAACNIIFCGYRITLV